MRYVNTNFTSVFESDGRRILADNNDVDQLPDSNAFEGNKATYGNNSASYPGVFKFNLKQSGGREY